MKCAIFLSVILSVFAIVRCGDAGDRFAEFMEIMAERAEEINIQFLSDFANALVNLTSSKEFKEFSNMVEDGLMEIETSYNKFAKGALDGFCELKDNPDATMEDVKNMLENIKMD